MNNKSKYSHPKKKQKLGMKPKPNFFFNFLNYLMFFLFKYTILRWTLNANYIRSFLFKSEWIFANFFIFKWILFKFFNLIKNSFNFKQKWTNIVFIKSSSSKYYIWEDKKNWVWVSYPNILGFGYETQTRHFLCANVCV